MTTPTWSTANRTPCSHPPDCPYAGGPGMCPYADDRTPKELHQLWSYCFGRPVADYILADWIRDVERKIVTCDRAAQQSTSEIPWADMAGRYRQQLAALRAVRTPAADPSR